MSDYHTPVLLDTAVEYLNVSAGKKYVDATLGGGGHAQKIRSLGGLVLGLDQDRDAIEHSKMFTDCIVKTNFANLEETVKASRWMPVFGILLDLGVSMHQFVTAERGFSIQADGPLDMRMDTDLPNTAANLINQLSIIHLAKIFKDFGEEPKAIFYAKKIVEHRPFRSTKELVEMIGSFDSAQRIFQALRIAVNDELGALEQVLPQALNVLEGKGRIVVISFHSLEDRIIKNVFNLWHEQKLGKILTKKPVEGEHHSKLRAFEKS